MKVQVILLASLAVGILADFFTPGLDFRQRFEFLPFLTNAIASPFSHDRSFLKI